MTDNTGERTTERSVAVRTVIKESVYKRLKEFAQKYSTGRGDWDFGVAIEILLDHHEYSQVSILNEKIDTILGVLSQEPQEEVQEPDHEVEFLGGEKE